MDFGLACPCGSENFLTGTPFYMSPEQIDCLPVDQRTDINGMGITAFEMLTGQRPYPEKDAWKVMDMHIKIDIPDPASLVPDIPEALSKFILKACARDLTERYQNMTEAIAEMLCFNYDFAFQVFYGLAGYKNSIINNFTGQLTAS